VDGVTLYDIDDLQSVVAGTLSVREAEAHRAETVVEAEISRFAEWLGSLSVLPTIRALRDYGDGIVDQVLAENSGRWEDASPRDLARIEAVARSIMNRLLHEPTLRMRTMGEARSHGKLQTMREFFGLDEGGATVEVPESDRGDNVRPLPRRATGGS
jgi:glutamyl-tRNA reductase